MMQSLPHPTPLPFPFSYPTGYIDYLLHDLLFAYGSDILPGPDLPHPLFPSPGGLDCSDLPREEVEEGIPYLQATLITPRPSPFPFGCQGGG